ncbi:MAG: glycosyltransferase family 2 protein [Vicinamibacterales bacterium]
MRSSSVTVVVPCRNGGAHVAAALESVFRQTRPPCAVHVIDDGSADDSVHEIERAFAHAGDVRCTLTARGRRGLSETRNELCAAASTDLIAFLDQDDLYAPTRLERLAAAAPDRGPYCGFSGLDFLVERHGDTLDAWRMDYGLRLAQAGCLPTAGFALLRSDVAVSGSNLVISRDLFDIVGGFDPDIPCCADWDFVVRALRVVEPTLVPARLLTYRQHGANLSIGFRDGPAASELDRVMDSYLQWALEPSPNRRAPTPGNWPRYFRLFACANATAAGWRLADRMPPHALKAGPTEAPGERAAIRALLEAPTSIESVSGADLDDLLLRCARAWNPPA